MHNRTNSNSNSDYRLNDNWMFLMEWMSIPSTSIHVIQSYLSTGASSHKGPSESLKELNKSKYLL